MTSYKYNRLARISDELREELEREKRELKKYEKRNYTYGEILEKKFIRSKRASIYDIFLFMTFTFLIIIFFAMWVYSVNLMDTVFSTIPTTNGLNVSNVASQTLGVVNTANQTWLPILAYTLIFGMVLSIFISNFLVKANPVFFIAYVIVTIVGLIMAVILSNTYEVLSTDPNLVGVFNGWVVGNFIMLYLPHLVSVVGILGALFLFAGIQRDAELGGGIQ